MKRLLSVRRSPFAQVSLGKLWVKLSGFPSVLDSFYISLLPDEGLCTPSIQFCVTGIYLDSL